MYLNTDGQEAPGIGFMLGDESNGADGLLVKNGVKSLADLSGKTIALEKETPAYILLKYAAKQNNIDFKTLKIKYMPAADAATAFIAGQVDAA
ncbi:NitT/TauT family transport system substrate-binding protein [Flexibacter flexilis DSM 6793]|uniref:NitT/TauT family transport system substrate-binding protein n=1 Tax=Flexibacter flexilis DSM 6793 TaxID=927664 RepID=A0A1I1N8E6_9BACT|nr:ABC transporter substrate-binding protein [Flexibacter flexilis]SFC93725.1 NitT/TauT family transport system substrate-binding protein [Flexibacter flexilis DSM 6793]